MKKYLFGALALPLLFACSSDDLIEKNVISNDQFAGIQKVDATFSMDEGQRTRFDGVGEGVNPLWEAQEGDTWGFAWLTNDYTGSTNPTIIGGDGQAYQNHNLIQTKGIFTPQTSIYVGKYFLYRPYDETTVDVGKINFSLAAQTIAEGYGSKTQAWRNLAKTAINIGDKWTEVTPGGYTIGTDPTIWDKAGTKQHYKLYPNVFSNQTGLDMTYLNNDVEFDGSKKISGATDIDFTPEAGTKVGAADIYSGTVELQNADMSFTYAPTVAPMTTAGNTDHVSEFWADKSNVAAGYSGFTFTKGAIALNAITDDAKNGIETEGKTSGWIWFNSLPVEGGDGTTASTVQTILTTSYGIVTINETVGSCAYEGHDYGIAPNHDFQWVKLVNTATDETKTPKEWNVGTENTFINQYGNHKGKFAFDVDFSKGVMNKMHIINDAHLQKALKYYIAAGKTETGATLLLDKDANNEFKISKISIALLQTINAGGIKVLVKACDEVDGVPSTAHTPNRIVVTQEGSDGKTEVPDLNKVFAAPTDVILAGNSTKWTWKERTGLNQLTVDGNVKSLTNEGELTVNATNIDLSVAGLTITNAKGATMKITQKATTAKTAIINLGTIEVGAADNTTAELRAYKVAITNDATALNDYGVINNYGVVGVSDTDTPYGEFNNYGLIDVKNADAITLLSTNEKKSDFDNHFDATTNKLGTVKIPSPTAIVSVNNAAANGFIKYTWDKNTKTYVTPEGNVKYNTIVVSGDIEFTEIENEIQYIEFDGTRTQVINNGYLKQLKGVIVNPGKSIIIEKGNTLAPKDGTFLGSGATVYRGGTFTHNASVVGTTASNYFGDWYTTQIVKY